MWLLMLLGVILVMSGGFGSVVGFIMSLLGLALWKLFLIDVVSLIFLALGFWLIGNWDRW